MKLKDNNQWDNTLIIFTSDNGGPEYLASTASNNFPLRGIDEYISPYFYTLSMNHFVYDQKVAK